MNAPFTELELMNANAEWGCNCGPSALAFALQMKLDAVRHAIPDFDRKRYTSPSMMKEALGFFKRGFSIVRPAAFTAGRSVDIEPMFSAAPALVRIQWCGPWTNPGANARWAYTHTHWIATWTERGVPLVFDCNSGITGAPSWIDEIVPLLTTAPRANGEWFPTHIWRLFTSGGAS